MPDDDEEEDLPFADAFEDHPDPDLTVPAPPAAPAQSTAPAHSSTAKKVDGQGGEEQFPTGGDVIGGAVTSVVSVIAAGAGAVGRRIVGSGGDHQHGLGDEGRISTSEVTMSHEGDASPWTLVELAQNNEQVPPPQFKQAGRGV